MTPHLYAIPVIVRISHFANQIHARRARSVAVTMDTKLVLVDGMPGTGKSTVSQFINMQLRDNGFSSQWHHEEANHPVRQFYVAARHQTWSDYAKEVLALWQMYVNEMGRLNRISVLDAALFQTHVRSMLIFDADRNAILELIHSVASTIAPLNPRLVYLKPASVEEHFREVAQIRGQRMLGLWVESHDQYPYTLHSSTSGYSAFLAFWEEYGKITDSIYESLNISKLRQNASIESWHARLSQICEFLNLSNPVGTCSTFDFARFAGEYALLDDDTSPRFRLQLRDECLVASVSNPTYDPNRCPIVRFEQTLLIPIGDYACALAGWPHVVQFIENGPGGEDHVQAIIHEEDSSESGDVYLKC